MSRPINVTVCSEDLTKAIAQNGKCDDERCVVAQAIKRTRRKGEKVNVFANNDIRIGGRHFKTAQRVTTIIENFDKGRYYNVRRMLPVRLVLEEVS